MPEINNYCPGTGVGRFDIALEGTRLKVKTKLFLATALDGPTARDFVDRFQELVKEHWEKKFGFHGDGLRYEEYCWPEFEIVTVNNMMDAHFVLNIIEGAGVESVARDRYYRVAQDHVGFAPTSANFYQSSVQPVNSSHLTINALKGSFPLYVDFSGTSPSDHAKSQVKLLAKQLAKLQPNIQVKVTAYGQNKTQKRTTVTQLLNNCGLNNVHTRHSKKSILTTSRSRSTNSTNYVKIALGDTVALDVSNHPLFTYPTASIHEYGHMLGLQDEYSCLGKQGSDKLLELQFVAAEEQGQWESFHVPTEGTLGERPARGQEYFINECNNAGVSPPHFGQHTYSIMSAGSKFRYCHFVTLWAALKQMTNGQQWAIVKHAQNNQSTL